MQKNKFLIRILLSMAILALPIMGHAEGGGGGGSSSGLGFDYRKKSDSKETKRWTLQEWMEQKHKNYVMDLWLGMYAPSPYEFFASGSYLSYDTSTVTTPTPNTTAKTSHRSTQGSIGAFATIMGLVGEYENNTEEGYNDLSGSLNLRVLGNAVQGTHLLLQYGLRTRNITSDINWVRLNQQFAGVDLDLYLLRHFGLHGNYRQFFSFTEPTLGDVTGTRSEAGAFIDFGALRIFGNWYTEKQDANSAGTITHSDRTGTQSGIKFFF